MVSRSISQAKRFYGYHILAHALRIAAPSPTHTGTTDYTDYKHKKIRDNPVKSVVAWLQYLFPPPTIERRIIRVN
jgi:hypothetical protein